MIYRTQNNLEYYGFTITKRARSNPIKPHAVESHEESDLAPRDNK